MIHKFTTFNYTSCDDFGVDVDVDVSLICWGWVMTSWLIQISNVGTFCSPPTQPQKRYCGRWYEQNPGFGAQDWVSQFCIVSSSWEWKYCCHSVLSNVSVLTLWCLAEHFSPLSGSCFQLSGWYVWVPATHLRPWRRLRSITTMCVGGCVYVRMHALVGQETMHWYDARKRPII